MANDANTLWEKEVILLRGTFKVPRGLISLHLDEQKLPPMGDELVVMSARVVPMTTAEWEAAVQKEDQSSEQDPESLKFLWDGK